MLINRIRRHKSVTATIIVNLLFQRKRHLMFRIVRDEKDNNLFYDFATIGNSMNI